MLVPVKIEGRFICILTRALLRVHSKEQFITAFKHQLRGVPGLGSASLCHPGKLFKKGHEIGSSLPVAAQLVPSG